VLASSDRALGSLALTQVHLNRSNASQCNPKAYSQRARGDLRPGGRRFKYCYAVEELAAAVTRKCSPPIIEEAAWQDSEMVVARWLGGDVLRRGRRIAAATDALGDRGGSLVAWWGGAWGFPVGGWRGAGLRSSCRVSRPVFVGSCRGGGAGGV